MANNLAVAVEEVEDVAAEVDEVARLEVKEEVATSSGTKRRRSRAELKVLFALLKVDTLISMAGNGNQLSEWTFVVWALCGRRYLLLLLVGKVKMHCIYTQRLLIDLNVLHMSQQLFAS